MQLYTADCYVGSHVAVSSSWITMQHLMVAETILLLTCYEN